MTKLAIAVAALLVVVAVPATADPIPITSGTFVVQGLNDFRADFSLVGADGSTIRGRWPSFIGYTQAGSVAGCGSSCPEGTAIGPAGTFAFGVPFYYGEPYPSGTAVLDGQTYNTLFGGSLVFSGPTTTLPSLQLGTDDIQFSLSLPFTFHGTLNGYDLLGYREAQLRFSQELTGEGVAKIDLLAYGPPGTPTRFTYIRTTYEFQPVPEPASLLLLGSGIAGAVIAKRRRRG